MATTAISDDFLTAFAQIPRKAQRGVREFTRKFRDDPMSAGINYEKLSRGVDPRLRSVRIGLDYRAIVLAPEEDNVYVLLWVDHHDEAYAWAAERRVEVHPSTGALQVYRTFEALSPTHAREEVGEAPSVGRFSSLSDADLMTAGVPRPLVPAVRAVYTDGDLDALAPHLPAEAAEVLTGVAAGMSLDEALEDALGRLPDVHAPPAVDVGDVVAALERVVSARRFRVLDAEFDLEAALDYPLDKWRVFLHPSQRRLVEQPTKGPMRVLGAAGTGKTVVAMHRAAHLVRTLVPEGRVLFTTYTVNLAADIAAQLEKITQPDELARIEVVGIDALALRLAREGGLEARLAMDRELEDLWKEAIDVYAEGPWGLEFYRAEWEDVVQAGDIREEQAYLQARRVGRGTKLRKTERRQVWPVFVRYRELLSERGVAEAADLLRAARRVVGESPAEHSYASVVVDETQDMGAPALELIRALAGPEHENDLFLVGDAHQRIYGRPVSLHACGINVRGRRSRQLRINYRTTDTIRRFAMRVIESERFDDLDEGTDEAKGYVSLRSGPQPEVRFFDDLAAERAYLVSTIQTLMKEGVPPEHICVAARTHEQIDQSYEPALRTAGIASEKLGREQPRTNGVRMATMHRIKGLEFPIVLLAGLDRGHMPLKTPELHAPDPVVAAHALKRERCLLYVASTRARDRLFVSASGTPSSLLARDTTP